MTQIIHLKQILTGWNTQVEIDVGNTIEYDVKLYQDKMTILKCTKVQIKGLNIFTSYRNICWYSQHVCDAIIYF